MNNVPYLNLKCGHCGEVSMLYQYHDMYHLGEDTLYLVCPICKGKLRLEKLEVHPV